MTMTDPVADFLTRIRNAVHAGHKSVDIPESRLKREISRVLAIEKFISHYIRIRDGKQGMIRIYLKYTSEGESVIDGLKRVSRPGLRLYYSVDEIPRVLNGLGVMILTTPKGVMTDKRARQLRVGGEPLCTVW
ncbi:MAG: 30S ribosomal protein S8 [Candidatus Hatepunaea meridiana]|nr:30S ribosomal protein S8 [Candidatus Hatepunaea meridiana]